MGKMGFGYGSEWQLLRMLGRHREYFDQLIQDELESTSTIKWFDFKFKGSQDQELLGEDVFKKLKLTENHPNILNKTNWDCVGEINGVLLLGEAKGNLLEFTNKDKTGAKDKSKKTYITLLEEILDFYEIDKEYLPFWTEGAYQLGNRIAMQYYLSKLRKPSLVLYIFFINDWKYYYGEELTLSGNKAVRKERVWLDAFHKKLETLGFKSENHKNTVMKHIRIVYPNCSPK